MCKYQNADTDTWQQLACTHSGMSGKHWSAPKNHSIEVRKWEEKLPMTDQGTKTMKDDCCLGHWFHVTQTWWVYLFIEGQGKQGARDGDGGGGRGGEGGIKNELEAFSCTFCPKCWSFEHSQSEKTYRSCLKTKNACTKCVPWMGDPFPLSVYLGRQNVIHVMKWTRPSPSSLHTVCKPSKTGQWEGLGTRLVKCTLGEYAPIKHYLVA